jgi:hypothetical protein
MHDTQCQDGAPLVVVVVVVVVVADLKSDVHSFLPFAAHAVPTCNDSDAKRVGLHLEHAQSELLHVCPKQETVRPGVSVL